MKILIGVGFVALFGAWIFMEFVSGSRESLKDAVFWTAMMLVFASSIEFRPKRRPKDDV